MASPYFGFSNIRPGYQNVTPVQNTGIAPFVQERVAGKNRAEQARQFDISAGMQGREQDEKRARLAYDYYKTDRTEGNKEDKERNALLLELHRLEEEDIATGATNPVLANRIRDMHVQLGDQEQSGDDDPAGDVNIVIAPPPAATPVPQKTETTTRERVTVETPAGEQAKPPWAGKYGQVPSGDARTQEGFDEDQYMLETEEEDARAAALDRKRNHQRYQALYNDDGTDRDVNSIKDPKERDRFLAQQRAREEDPEADVNARGLREKRAPAEAATPQSAFDTTAPVPSDEALAQIRANPNGIPRAAQPPPLGGLPSAITRANNPRRRYYRHGRLVSDLPSTEQAMADTRTGYQRILDHGMSVRQDPIQQAAFKYAMRMAEANNWAPWFNQKEIARVEKETYFKLLDDRNKALGRQTALDVAGRRATQYAKREQRAEGQFNNDQFKFGEDLAQSTMKANYVPELTQGYLAAIKAEKAGQSSNPVTQNSLIYQLAHLNDPRAIVTTADFNVSGGESGLADQAVQWWNRQVDREGSVSPRRMRELNEAVKSQSGMTKMLLRIAYENTVASAVDAAETNSEALRGFRKAARDVFSHSGLYRESDFQLPTSQGGTRTGGSYSKSESGSSSESGSVGRKGSADAELDELVGD